MIKKIIFSIMQTYWRLKFARKATLRGRVYFGRHTRVQLSDGSKKEDVVIGDNVKLYGVLISQAGGKIQVENSAHIGPFTTIGATNSVRIGAYAMISTNVVIVDNNNHPTHPADRLEMNSGPINSPLKRWNYSRSSPIIIGANTWVGRNSAVMKGVTVGEGSIVAAFSIVTRNVESNAVVAGNPARVVKQDIDREPRSL